MDSYPSIPSQQQQQQQHQQQQQTGYNNNPLNHALLQQAPAHQYNFGTHSINTRVVNTQQQQMAMERNYGAMGNPNLQQMRGLNGEGGNNMANQYTFQSRQSLPASTAHPIPSISALGTPIYNNNNMTTTNILGFPSQNNINGLGLEVFPQPVVNRALGQTQRPNIMLLQQQQQQQQQQIQQRQYQQQQQNQQQQQLAAARQRQRIQQQQQMMQQIRRPMTNPSPVQNLHQRSSHQKQSAESAKKPASTIPKPYEPAPDLTDVQKQYLEQYVRRDTLYQKALDLQHKRQMNIISEKRKEITQAELRHQTRQSTHLFGPGYEGYGNGITGTKFRIVYPHDRKRPKKTKEFKFSLQQLKEIAEKEDLLVPIRLEIDGADGYKLRDTFTWNIND